jgi:small subunit ribosomal protein S16
VKIRLMRVGKKKQPSYRVVVADSRSPRDGRYIEIIGQYRPREEPSAFTVDSERALEWLRKGAQPSEQVHRLMVGSGLWEQYESERSSTSLAARVATRKAKGAEVARAAKEAAKADEAARAKAEAEAQPADAEPAEAAEEPEAEAASEGGDDTGE